ncbi:MAG: hypothetical protein KDC98_00215 [Planctomycetes bacterium]|nr:hypothetical protein [Planctomycetota bacterium]
MARRSSAASRSSRSSSSSRSTRSAGATAGRVDAPCPQCGTRYRVSRDALDEKLECQECHRVFFPKTTAGKRVKTQDYTKVYVGFGIGALFILITFMMMSGGNDEPVKKTNTPTAPTKVVTRGNHPRTAQLVTWANAIHTRNDLVIGTHSDLAAIATAVEAGGSDAASVIAALQTHASTQYLRDLECTSGSLTTDADMTGSSGHGDLYLVPAAGNKDYENDRAEVRVAFHMDGEQVKVESWEITRQIRRLTPDPNRKGTFKPNEHIERAQMVEISDSAGTRKVMESEPGPVPHWEGADAVLRQKVDEVIAGVLQSAEEGGPPLARFTLKIATMDERKAAVPRALNAMFELYGDVAGNKMKVSQLDRALREWTGFATNFQIKDTGDATKDKTQRESCIRQWFGFWWRYSSGDLSDFLDMRDNLEDPLPGEEAPAKEKK